MGHLQKRRVLIVAYHVPPVQGGSGVHRIMSLVRHLPKHGWLPTVLTVHPSAYPKTCEDNETLLPPEANVVRCLALDVQKHLSIRGRFPQFLALPDRWRSWVWFGVSKGMRIIREMKPEVIMSSFPIASANLIARELHRRTKIPWIADLRDPMVLDTYPKPGPVRRHYEAIEASTFAEAARVVVTTPGAASTYEARYDNEARNKVCIIENGFEEEMFEALDVSEVDKKRAGKLTILHSGVVYDRARDPSSIFAALSSLLSAGEISAERFELVFRASYRDTFVLDRARQYGVESVVSVKPPISHSEALAEMLASDSLLILQSFACRNQIPAKAYEYLRCRKPIIGLTGPESDTGRLLRKHGVADIAPLEDYEAVAEVVSDHLQRLWSGAYAPEPLSRLRSLSRRSRAAEFATILDMAVRQ